MKTPPLLLFVFSLLLIPSCKSPYTSNAEIHTEPTREKFNDSRTYKTLQGRWYGKQKRVDGGVREWIVEHNEDGTYAETFVDKQKNGDVSISTEYGEWGSSGYIYFTIFRGFIENGEKKPSDPTKHWTRNAYEIVRLNLDEFVYRDLERNDRFRVIRVSKEFQIKTEPTPAEE